MSQKDMLDEIDGAVEMGTFEPSEWEEEFLGNIKRRVGKGKELSESQEEKLIQIWEKATQ